MDKEFGELILVGWGALIASFGLISVWLAWLLIGRDSGLVRLRDDFARSLRMRSASTDDTDALNHEDKSANKA